MKRHSGKKTLKTIKNIKLECQKKWRDISRRNLHNDQFIEVSIDGKIEGYSPDQKTLAQKFGVTVGMISNCLRGYRKEVKGYSLRYVDSVTLKGLD